MCIRDSLGELLGQEDKLVTELMAQLHLLLHAHCTNLVGSQVWQNRLDLWQAHTLRACAVIVTNHVRVP